VFPTSSHKHRPLTKVPTVMIGMKAIDIPVPDKAPDKKGYSIIIRWLHGVAPDAFAFKSNISFTSKCQSSDVR